MPVEDHCKQSAMTVWLDKEKSKSKQGIVAGAEGLVMNEKKMVKGTRMDDNSKTQMITSKKSCVCAPTSHTGSFRCRLHRVGGDGKKSSSSFYSKNNSFMMSGGCGSGSGSGGGDGSGAAAGGLGKGRKMRLSRFSKSACYGASQEDDRSGGETSISCS